MFKTEYLKVYFLENKNLKNNFPLKRENLFFQMKNQGKIYRHLTKF